MPRHPAVEGALRALTLAPGILPLGMLFGAAAASAGMSPLAATLLSALVFAGGAQLASLALLGGGAALAAVALVGIVNSRYFLLSAAALDLARRAGATRAQRILMALGVVDETYALQSGWAKLASPPVVGFLALSLAFWLMWVASTLAGALLGERLPDLEPFGLDYALPGIFVGLLGIFADTRERLLAGLAALALAGVLAYAGFTTLAVLVVPPLLAFGLGRWRPARG